MFLANIAKENSLEVTDADIQQAVMSEAMMRPGQEKIVIDYYEKPENKDKLRGPILEEKAVDHILTKISVKNVDIPSDEFFKK